MATKIQMVNPVTGAVKDGFSGISWTCLLFGPCPALFRGHIGGFAVMSLLYLTVIAPLIFTFTYNGWHYNWLVKQGYQPAFGLNRGISQNANSVASVINVHVGNVEKSDDVKSVVTKPKEEITPEKVSA
jgi:hypothetical protein